VILVNEFELYFGFREFAGKENSSRCDLSFTALRLIRNFVIIALNFLVLLAVSFIFIKHLDVLSVL
jgi:hypothetical protein